MPEQTQTPPPGMPPGAGGGEAGGPAAQPGAAPAGSPMSGPTGKEGEKTAAKMWVAHVALPALEKALTVLGSSTPEGQSILTALKALSKDFGSNRDGDVGMNSMTALLGRRVSK